MPRAGLSHAAVVAMGAMVADEIGWEQLTLAAVARRAGVRLPSLYKHIDSLEGLRRDIGVLALHELREALGAAAVGRARAEALAALCHAYRTYARAHPGRYAATIAAPGPEEAGRAAAAEAVLTVVYAVLAGYGLGGDGAIDATRMLRAALHGFVALENGGGFGMPRDVGRTFATMIAALDRSFARAATSAEG